MYVSISISIISCLYDKGERDVAGMFDTLEPLHEMMDKGPQTLKEISFSQVHRL